MCPMDRAMAISPPALPSSQINGQRLIDSRGGRMRGIDRTMRFGHRLRIMALKALDYAKILASLLFMQYHIV